MQNAKRASRTLLLTSVDGPKENTVNCFGNRKELEVFMTNQRRITLNFIFKILAQWKKGE